MYSSLFVIGLAALAGELPPTPTVAPVQAQAPRTESFAELNRKLQRALERDNLGETLAIVEAMIAHPDYPALPTNLRSAIRLLEGAIHLDLERPEAALPLLIEVTAGSGAPFEAWRLRLRAHSFSGDAEGAADALTTILTRFPGNRDEFNPDILRIVGSPELDEETAFVLRLALLEAGWRGQNDSFLWLSLIDDLLARDRPLEAKPLVERVTSASGRLQLAALHRYDPVRPPGVIDVVAVLEEELEQTRGEAAAPGATVSDRNSYIWDLLTRGRFADALAEAEAVLATPAPDAGTDSGGQDDLTWTMDTRARALFELGRADEAIDQMRTAAARSESGEPNVSQSINLGWLNLRLGRNAAALAAVAEVSGDSVSAYGRMQRDGVAACAAHALGDDVTAGPLFAHIEANWRDAPVAAYEAAACRGDEAAMARMIIDVLGDPDHASTGVDMMHDYLVVSTVTDFDRRLRDLHQRVAARPDVLAARDRVGRGLSVPTTGILF